MKDFHLSKENANGKLWLESHIPIIQETDDAPLYVAERKDNAYVICVWEKDMQ